ncbi:hypothetical protein ACP4OV_024415 [Aristida adscensionis]
MDGGAGASPALPRAEAIAAVRDARLPTPSDDDDFDDLYGDVNVGFLPLLPLSPSPAPASPPKTPSPGLSPSPPPPQPQLRGLAPEPQPEPELQPKPATPRHQPPRPPPAPAPRRYMPPPPPRAPRGDTSSSSPPRCTAVYVSELHWWTTDAEVETALAPYAAGAALQGLHFYSDKYTGKSRGVCRANFLHRDAAAAAAAALHGRAFHGRHCVASLSRPPVLSRLADDSDVEAATAPNTTRGRGNGGPSRGAGNVTAVRGNVGSVQGDRPALAPLPPRSMAPRPPGLPFLEMMGGSGGYGRFQSMGQYSGGMCTGMMSSAILARLAGGMPVRAPGVWHDQGMAGGLWGSQQPWIFRGCQMPWQQLMPPGQHHQAQQQHRNGEYGNGRGMVRERLGSRSGEKGIDNVRSYPKRRQYDNYGGDWYKEHDEERVRHRQRVLEKERDSDQCGGDAKRCQDYTEQNERHRHGGKDRRYQEYTERDDRRGRVRSRSQSRDAEDDDYPRRRR